MGQNNHKKSRKQKHEVPRRVINKLQDSLSVPLFSFDKNGEVGVVIDDYDASGKRIVVAIHKDQEMDRKPVNVIKSIYGLDAPEQWIANQISKGKTFTVYDAEKTNVFLQTYGYLASMGENNRPSVKTYHN